MRAKLVVFCCLAVVVCVFARSKTTSKFGTAHLNEPGVQGLKQFQSETNTRFNKAVDDIDSILLDIGGVTTALVKKDSADVTEADIDTLAGTTTVDTLTGRQDNGVIINDTVKVVNAISIGGASYIDSLTMIDGTNDTLVISIGAKTWKFDPVADQ